MNKPIYGWKKQLNFGLEKQKLFAEKYGLVSLDGTGADLQTPDGRLIELKSDRRALSDTNNLFIERYSSSSTRKDGGPWGAINSGCTWFIYQFTDEIKCYGVSALVAHLNDNLHNYRALNIRNLSYDTVGYLVPAADLIYLEIPIEKIVANT